MAIRTLGSSALAYRVLHLFPTDTTLGWRKLHRIGYVKGEKKVALGIMRRVNDELGNHIGYQIVAAAAARVDLDISSQPSSAAISRHEMDVNAFTAFADGRSRTAGLPEHRRNERMAAHRAPEDRVERVQRKIAVYPHVGAAKGDVLRVWPR